MKEDKDQITPLKLPVSPVIINDDKFLPSKIKILVENEMFAILCTQGENQPYGSIIAYSTNDDLTKIIFATPVNTRKYSLLSSCSNIALVIDDRSKFQNNLQQISAVTITGKARQLVDELELKQYSHMLIDKHCCLKDFLNSKTSAVFVIESLKYFYVEKFQQLNQWKPDEKI